MLPCETDPDLWFSDKPEEIELAKDRCLDCPFRQYKACEKEGWKHEYGVFGGLSGEDRKAKSKTRYAKAVSAADATANRRDRKANVARALRLHGEGKTAKEIGEEMGIAQSTILNWFAGASVTA